MTKFLDGPAEGKVLMLKRTPIFLRAVRGPAGEWDALDQLADTPKSDETIVVYHMAAALGWVHVRARAGSGCYAAADYRVMAEQPADAVLRDTAAWRAWCVKQLGESVGEDGSINVGPRASTTP